MVTVLYLTACFTFSSLFQSSCKILFLIIFNLRVGQRAIDGGARTVDETSPERASRDIHVTSCRFATGADDLATLRGRRIHFGNVRSLHLNSSTENARLEISSECIDVSGMTTAKVDLQASGQPLG